MRFRHATPKRHQIALWERLNEAKDALVFADDVMTAAEDDFWKIVAMREELRGGDVSQSGYVRQKPFEHLHALFALRAALVVFATGMAVFHHGVAYDDGDSGRQRQERVVKGSTVHEKSVADATETGCELVHDADTRAHEFDFGALAEFGDFQ